MTLEIDDQLQSLKDFASSENKQLVDNLEKILEDVGKTGQYVFPWHFMKPLYAHKLDLVTSTFLEANPPLNIDGSVNTDEVDKLKTFREELLSSFDRFLCAPFTIQRVTELLTNPKRHYKSSAKFFRGLEKNIMVVSTIDMVTPEQRLILKRQLQEELAKSAQNGTAESDLKPPQKKTAFDTVNSDVDYIGNENVFMSEQRQDDQIPTTTSYDATTENKINNDVTLCADTREEEKEELQQQMKDSTEAGIVGDQLPVKDDEDINLQSDEKMEGDINDGAMDES